MSATPDAHTADSEIYFRLWNGPGGYNDAANWAPARLAARGDGTRLASGRRGVYLMYHDPRAQGTAQTRNYWVRRYDAAANAFEAPKRVSRGAVNDVGGDFMQDAGGNLHAVFMGREPRSRKEVRHRVSRDGVRWDPIRVLATHRARQSFREELRVGAGADGGGAAVVRGSRSSAGIYLLTFGPVGGGGDGTCVPSVTVGVVVVRALEGCLRGDGPRYTTAGAVKVNGVDVEPQRRGAEVYRLTVDTRERTLETRGEANVRVGGVVLDRRAIAWKLPQGEGKLQRLGVPDVSVFPDLARFAKTLFSFPVKGDAELRVARGATALIDTSLQMPALLGGVTGDVTLRTTDQQGLVLDRFRIKVPQARIGKLRIAAVEVVYESDPDVFKGSAEIQLPPAYGPPLKVAFGFREGRLNLLHADKRFDPTLPIVGAPPEPVVGLDLLGFDYLDEAGSRTFQGLVELQGGPEVRGLFRVSELDGKVTLTFPPEPQPASIDATGELKVVGIPFATGHVRYSTDNLFSFDGTFQFPPPGKWGDVASFSASVAGFLALSRPYPFSAAGAATATIAGVSGSGEAVISSRGVTGCIPLPGLIPDLGVSYRWGDDYPTPTCNVGDFKLQAPGAARAAQGVPAVSVPGGLPQAAIALVGRGGAPTVTVTAPSGEQVTTGSEPAAVGRFITQQFDEAATTYVSIGQPPAGRYTIAPAPGSPPIDRIGLARGLPDPKVTAKVTGKRRTRTLQLPDRQDRRTARHLRRAIGRRPLPRARHHAEGARPDPLPSHELEPAKAPDRRARRTERLPARQAPAGALHRPHAASARPPPARPAHAQGREADRPLEQGRACPRLRAADQPAARRPPRAPQHQARSSLAQHRRTGTQRHRHSDRPSDRRRGGPGGAAEGTGESETVSPPLRARACGRHSTPDPAQRRSCDLGPSSAPVCSMIAWATGSRSARSSPWPAPSRRSSLAPGISRASASPCATGNIGSAVPWMTSVGAVIEDRGPGGPSPWDMRSWFCIAAKSRARSTSRLTSSRTRVSSNARSPPARMRE